MRTTGYDTSGNPVALGDTDSDGYLVGYIDDDGLAHESLLERDKAITAGRYLDAWNAWNRTGGALGVEPQPEPYAVAYAHPDHFDEAVEWAREMVDMARPGGMLHASIVRARDERAGLN